MPHPRSYDHDIRGRCPKRCGSSRSLVLYSFIVQSALCSDGDAHGKSVRIERAF